VVLFEFSGPEPTDFPALSKFFDAIPRDFRYAVEIRNPELVNPGFYSLLRAHDVSPAFSHWTKMPSVRAQFEAYLTAGGGADHGPIVALSLVRPGRTFEEAVRMFQPYREMKDIYDDARDELAAIGNFAMQNGRKAYILVSNRLEGSAPVTIGAVAEKIGSKRL
jgi:hypothetical protein